MASAWPKAALGGLATCERAAAVAQHTDGNPRATTAGLLRRKGATHTGEDTTVHRRDRGGSKAAGMRRRQARPAGHGGRALARAAGAREGRQEANGEWRVSRGGSSIRIWGAGGRAACGDGEGVRRPCKKDTSTYRLTRGARRSGQSGRQFWLATGRISYWA